MREFKAIVADLQDAVQHYMPANTRLAGLGGGKALSRNFGAHTIR